MNLCFIISSFLPITIGGVEKYLIYLSNNLKRNDFSTTILTRYYPPLLKKELYLDYTLFRIGLNPFPYTKNRYIGGISSFLATRFTFSVLGFYEALKIVKDCDIIHAQLGGFSAVHLGIKLSKQLKKPLLITIHGKFGNDVEDIVPNKRLLNELKKADLLIVNRDNAYNFLNKHKFKNIVTMYNSISFNKYKKPNDFKRLGGKIKILFIGRLTHRKGIYLAINGFAQALINCSNIELWIVGYGSLKDQLTSYVNKLGIQKNVIFYGKQFDVRPFLWNSSIFLATSPIANFPSLSLREAMAAGLAVVATNVGETKNLIKNYQTGILVPPDPQKIGNAINLLNNNDILRQSISKATSEYAKKNLDIDKYIKKLILIYKELI